MWPLSPSSRQNVYSIQCIQHPRSDVLMCILPSHQLSGLASLTLSPHSMFGMSKRQIFPLQTAIKSPWTQLAYHLLTWHNCQAQFSPQSLCPCSAHTDNILFFCYFIYTLCPALLWHVTCFPLSLMAHRFNYLSLLAVRLFQILTRLVTVWITVWH